MQLRTIYAQQFAPQKLLGKSEQTDKLYRSTLGLLARYLAREPVVTDLTDAEACRFLAWYKTTGVSIRSVNNRRDYLLAFWRWCARKRIVEEWPDVEKLPTDPIEPDSWSLDEVRRLIAATRDEPQVGKQPGWLFWESIHLVWWDSGERTTATLSCRWRDYSAETGLLFIPASMRKGKKKHATYHLKPRTRELLSIMRALDPAAELIFATPFTPHTFYHRYERILKRAGLPSGRRNKPQKMRRTFASYIEANGGDATEALQHTARRVTTEHYIDPRIVVRPPPNLLLPEVG